MKRVCPPQPLYQPAAAMRQEYIKFCVRRIDVKLVVALVTGWFQEKLPHVIVPRVIILPGYVREKIRVLHLCGEVQVLAVPQESCACLRFRRPILFPQPGQVIILKHRSPRPGRFSGIAVNQDRTGRPQAFCCLNLRQPRLDRFPRRGWFRCGCLRPGCPRLFRRFTCGPNDGR